MTLGTIAERVEHALQDTADHLDSEKVDHKIIYKVAFGKQLFTVTWDFGCSNHSNATIVLHP